MESPAARALLSRLATEASSVASRRERVKRLAWPQALDDLVNVLREVRAARVRNEVGSMENGYAVAACERLATELALALGEDRAELSARIAPLC
jgi:hypothetical protein